MKNIINYLFIIKLLLFICGLGIILHIYGNNKLTIIEGYTIGVTITTISVILFNKFQKNSMFLKKYRELFKLTGLLIALIGCIIWFIGEYLVFRGFEDKPIIDTIGAFACSIAALITLIIYVEEI